MRTCEERTRDVLERRDAYREKQQRQQSVLAFGTLCGALILSICVGMLPRFRSTPTVMDPASYAEVYEALDKERVYYLYADDEGIIQEDAAVDVNAGNATRPTGSTAQSSKEHSETNLQVVGVDEADIIKTDGRYLYVLSGGRVVVVDPNDGYPQVLAEFTLSHGEASGYGTSGMYLVGDRLVVMQYRYVQLRAVTAALVYDIADPAKPSFVTCFEQDGRELSSRVIGDVLYTVSQYSLVTEPIETEPATFVPRTGCDGEEAVLSAQDIHICGKSSQYIVVTAVRVSGEGEQLSQKAVLTSGNTVYANTENFYIAGYGYGTRKTPLVRFALNGGKLEKQAETTIDGVLLNQFSLDEYDGHLRVVITEYGENGTTNALLVLDKDLNTVGSLKELAQDERVYSVRFDGEAGYFVTFRQVDPLFTVDLSDPTKPTIQSELKIPGFSQYLHPYGDGKLLGIGMDADENGRTTFMKLSMFDVSDPTAVTESNVTVLDQRDSEVLSNHKAVLIDMGKNLIGFATGDNTYHLYGYDAENGFVLKARLAALDGYGTRGIYIGEYLYVTSANGVLSYRLSDFSSVGVLSIVKAKQSTAGTVSTSVAGF
ncbi:MAG: beta-propeller domain-containing protein [Clostridia bacterium]|nr:beta-propeller domain-containing protein [Clostridia bacterium]